ncbi:hypothetical protein HJG60_008931 [Phyllostomus discolor]|uniref:Uncharacterized protein n=1 Tax=Phyllostomus discolor TaxID=89673 RepID=A0A834DG21_9CHIR|nr:hypothetical protein HJG60_008931 [Phyllostomus discolor]
MCAGLRLGCKDSSGNNYFLLSFKKKNPTETGITPLCRASHCHFQSRDGCEWPGCRLSHSTRLGLGLQVTSRYQYQYWYLPARASAGPVEGARLVPRGRQRDGPLLPLTGGCVGTIPHRLGWEFPSPWWVQDFLLLQPGSCLSLKKKNHA